MVSTASSRPRDDTSWAAVGAVVAAGIVASVQIGKAAIATPMLQADLGLDLAAVGLLTAVVAILGAIGGIAAGAIVASAGDRRVLVLGLVAIAVGAAVGAVAPSFSVLLAGRALEGLGFLLVTVAGPAILQRVVSPAERDIAFAIWSCFMPAGMAFAMLAGPLFSDWRMIWWASALLAVAAIVLGAVVVPRMSTTVSVSWDRIVADAGAVIQGRGPILLASCFALYSLMFFALFSFLPVLLIERMEVTLGTAGLLSALANGANVVGNLAAGYLLARGVHRWAMIVGACVVMGLSALGIFLPVFPAPPTLLLCVVFSAVGGLIPATLLSSAPILSRSAVLTPIVVGLTMQGSNLGQVIGPVLVGGAIQAYGWPAAASVVLLSAVLASGAGLALRPAFGRVDNG